MVSGIMTVHEAPPVSIGATVYDGDGTRIGTVRGFDEKGFYVTAKEGIRGLSVTHEHTIPEMGEAQLMWRCSACGEVGDVEDIPASCPACGAPREDLYYWTED